jgi:hypothetical protein
MGECGPDGRFRAVCSEGGRLRNGTRNWEGTAPVSTGSRRRGSGLRGATRSGAWREVIDAGPRHAFGKPRIDREERGIIIESEESGSDQLPMPAW